MHIIAPSDQCANHSPQYLRENVQRYLAPREAAEVSKGECDLSSLLNETQDESNEHTRTAGLMWPPLALATQTPREMPAAYPSATDKYS